MSTVTTPASSTGRPPLVPWSQSTWLRWRQQRRMCSKPIARTKFLLLKVPASTLYEDKFGGDVGMFTIQMFVERMMSKQLIVGMAVDCTSIDIQIMEESLSLSSTQDRSNSNNNADENNSSTGRYFHDTNEWDDYDVEYTRLSQNNASSKRSFEANDGGSCSDGQNEAAAAMGAPTEATVNCFMEKCQSNWSNRPNTHICVFDCMGGLGAAAFVVVSYMVQRMKAPLHVALASVQDVMEPGIFDERLLRLLQQRYKGRKEITVPLPPGWHVSYEEGEEGEQDDSNRTERDTDGNESGDATFKKTAVIIAPYCENMKNRCGGYLQHDIHSSSQSNAVNGGTGKRGKDESYSVPGLQEQSKDSCRYQRAVAVVLQLLGITGKNNSTPHDELAMWCSGPSYQMITRDLSRLEEQFKEDGGQYVVTWSPIGRKGLLLILNDGVFFLESTHATSVKDTEGISEEGQRESLRVSHAAGMSFPRPTDPKQTQHRTLLYGVLVLDKADPSASSISPRATSSMPLLIPRFLAFDILSHEGGMLRHKPYKHRLKYLSDGVYEPRKKNMTRDSTECLHFRPIEIFGTEKVAYLLTSLLPTITHGCDGLAFFNKNLPLIYDDVGKESKERCALLYRRE